jgi:hypothetical protein
MIPTITARMPRTIRDVLGELQHDSPFRLAVCLER